MHRAALRMMTAGGLFVASFAHAQEPARVELSLEAWNQLQAERNALLAAHKARDAAPRAAVGQTRYRGRSSPDVLEMQLDLTVNLPPPATYREVPVIGLDAIIIGATVDREPVELVLAGRYWVWVAKDTGTFDVEVEFLVPPQGPRGSLEYRFGVVESPVTNLGLTFDRAGLSPQVSRAVTQSVSEAGRRTTLLAVLEPTSEIHVLGLYDVGQTTTDPAKLYAESHSLVSLSDDAIEMFSVIRYTILYATEKRFAVRLPAGWEVISADGQGAFSYRIATEDHRPVLRGETAFGIEDRYEVSLRLRRPRGPAERRIMFFSPEVLGVERDAGFVAIEVPGKLSIERVEGDGYTPIDVRSLPPAILESSVSPIVHAFRYGTKREGAQLVVADHPERALAASGIDRVRAASVVTADGKVMTDLTLTLRNRLRQALELELPEGAEVQSAHLQNEPVQPSQNPQGWLVMPLRRSARVGGALESFSVQLVYRQDIEALGSWGEVQLHLPRLKMPISSLEWSVYAPSSLETSRLEQAVRPQRYVREARFTSPPPEPSEISNVSAYPGTSVEEASGTLPVRVRLPRSGHRMVSTRYWIDAEEPLTARFSYRSEAWAATRTGLFAIAGLLGLGLVLLVGYGTFRRLVPPK